MRRSHSSIQLRRSLLTALSRHAPRRRRSQLFAGLAICAAIGTCAAAVVATERWRDIARRTALIAMLRDPAVSDSRLRDAFNSIFREEREEEEANRSGHQEKEEADDPLLDLVHERLRHGALPSAVRAEQMRIAHEEAQRWAGLMPRGPGARQEKLVEGAVGLAWLNMGPANEVSGDDGGGGFFDTGRIADIRIDPTTPTTVYIATAGGGVWKTTNFDSAPTWSPITDTTGNLSMGAIEIDPESPQTIYVGTGDPYNVTGGQILKSTNGGTTWGAPLMPDGAYSYGGCWELNSSGGCDNTPRNFRFLRVDPKNSSIILAGADTGLFRSTNGGTTWSLLTLPNPTGQNWINEVWSIVYTGSSGSVSHWAMSGIYLDSSTTMGDIWVSTDAGATWSSRGAAGALPSLSTGRITLGAGAPVLGGTAIYAQVANTTGSAQTGIWRSLDSGSTWTSALGTLSNPTQSAAFCQSQLVGGVQSWYGQAVAVDPQNNDQVIIGGMICVVRSLNGTAASPTWDLIGAEFDLPTSTGSVPYVHEDWHALNITRSAGGYQVLGGDDGGLWISTNAFSASPVTDQTVTWSPRNIGVVTDLAYNIGSGDPVTGNPFVTLIGLQDNGMSIRDSESLPTSFDETGRGGDGFGTVVMRGGTPATTVYWASIYDKPLACNPATDAHQCKNKGGSWPYKIPTLSCSGEAIPNNVAFAAVPTDTLGPTVLTISNQRVYRITGDPTAASGAATWTAVSSCLTGTLDKVEASSTIDGLYGVATADGHFWTTSNCTSATVNCTWHESNILQYDVNGDHSFTCGEELGGSLQSSQSGAIAFPPVTPAGHAPGDVFVAGSTASVVCSAEPVPAALGHLFITHDGGSTWSPLHGAGASNLPNVPINVVKYDPTDPNDNTIYVGTNLGVYVTLDGGQTWQRFGAGMPLVEVTDLFVGQAGNLIRAATYGRGAWEIYPKNVANGNGNGDIDVNGQIDEVDLLGLAARLGTTPATSSVPYYDYTDNLTGATDVVDESDLSQLLLKFGQAP